MLRDILATLSILWLSEGSSIMYYQFSDVFGRVMFRLKIRNKRDSCKRALVKVASASSNHEYNIMEDRKRVDTAK
jgi:hypothetical protein